MPDKSPDNDLYDLAPDPAPPPPPRPARPVASTAVRPLSYRAPADESPAPADPETLRDLWIPLWLLAGGVAVHVVAALLTAPTFKVALAGIAVQLVAGTGVMLVGILLAARFRGVQLGRFWTTVFKLAAVSVAPTAILILVQPVLWIIPFGWLIGWVAVFILYFVLLGVLFDLDESDTWYIVCTVFIISVALRFIMLFAFG